ncbi:uncharacterized protein C8A04DRAFT_32728 [Dichotomopilus funicola]|uniref:Uncharacterized protein n=1 Tax=Dichotomopilus funicola TaxID=1934379 RepID=A0AAN6ZJE4_9PEZI|nr:hypothetical protein C8A04DRAFT_32728 [Dichotomopilus funicola]
MNNSGTSADRPAVRPPPPQRTASSNTTSVPLRPAPAQSAVSRPQPQGQRPQGQQPRASQPQGNQPQGNQPQPRQQPPQQAGPTPAAADGLNALLAAARKTGAIETSGTSTQSVPLSRTPIPTELLPEVAHALNEALGPVMPFAFVKGIAMRYLGMSPEKAPPSHQIEIVTPGVSVRALRAMVEKGKQEGWFGSWEESGVRVVYYRGMDGGRYRVVVWSPQALRIRFAVARTPAPAGMPPSAKGWKGEGPVVRVGVGKGRVLKPAGLLDAACDMWNEFVAREDEDGMKAEGANIAFLLGYMVANRVVVSQGELGEMGNAMDRGFREELGKRANLEGKFAAVGLKQK